MTKVTIQTSCANSPKREFLKDFNVAFGTGDAEFIIANVTDDIHWQILGDKIIDGIEDFQKNIQDMASTTKVNEITIDQVISHGKEGAVNGLITLKNGEQYAFADFYLFKNTKSTLIETITSYVIKIQ